MTTNYEMLKRVQEEMDQGIDGGFAAGKTFVICHEIADMLESGTNGIWFVMGTVDACINEGQDTLQRVLDERGMPTIPIRTIWSSSGVKGVMLAAFTDRLHCVPDHRIVLDHSMYPVAQIAMDVKPWLCRKLSGKSFNRTMAWKGGTQAAPLHDPFRGVELKKPRQLPMARELIMGLIEAGLVCEDCTRVVIDLRIDEVIQLYQETLADDRILEIDLPGHIGAAIKEQRKEKKDDDD